MLVADGTIDMPATLNTLGLPSSSVLVVNKMPDPSGANEIYVNTEQTLEVPVLPSWEDAPQQPPKRSGKGGKTRKGQKGQQQMNALEPRASTSRSSSMASPFHNVETVTVVGKQYAMVRKMCWEIAAMFRDLQHHRDNGEGLIGLLKEKQAWMNAVCIPHASCCLCFSDLWPIASLDP